jgi:signal peptidase I
MKKTLIFIGCFIGLLFTFLLIARVTNIFQRFKVSSGANEPTLEMGKHFFASKLKKPERFDFICFDGELSGVGKAIFVYRLCGMEGDIVEIKNGDLFVNHKMVDDQLNLIQRYIISAKDYAEIVDLIPDSQAYPSGDSVHVMMSAQLIKTKHINAVRETLSLTEFDKDISERFSRKWNQDHFGPITVPPGNYFVLGDNRYSAADSRYQGFIPEEKFVATVLWK